FYYPPEPMHTNSLGFRTDLMLAACDGEVVSGPRYIAARTPACPQFWWGNFVLFDEPPPPGAGEHWEAVFDREVGCVPGIRHRNLAWDAIDGSQGDAQSFVARGYALTENVFLTANETRPTAHDRADLDVRPLNTDAQWLAALIIAQRSFDASASFQAFQEQQMRRQRALVNRGVGQWFGAFRGDDMVATMGLFVREGLGRCQGVATAPEHRRQGCCSTLLHGVCSHGFAQMGAEQIVIMTAADNAAARVYESVGFQQSERVSSLSMATL
ncbi:MAG: GNAT family N-acetyltransferase, partial [Planctomycetales bacterium]|nr:GNAT family N-acetyltransferase [Planctomycetales bacterium]